MSMYNRIRTPSSPLMPVTPIFPSDLATPNKYLSPCVSFRGRRSFTPYHLNTLSPPSVSPIQAALLSSKTKTNKFKTPTQTDSRLLHSANTSMKLLRSSARKEEGQHQRLLALLNPIRRSLFAVTPPIHEMDSMESEASSHLIEQMAEHSIFEETFTVKSILKEINMEKYVELFEHEEIDLFVFCLLNKDDLITLGIDKADRAIIMNAIKCYNDVLGSSENLN